MELVALLAPDDAPTSRMRRCATELAGADSVPPGPTAVTRYQLLVVGGAVESVYDVPAIGVGFNLVYGPAEDAAR